MSTSGNKATDNFGGAVYIIGLAIAYGLTATSLMGYALTVARDREKGVFQRLRVTPAPTWTIMSSRLAMQSIANLIIALVVVIIGTRIHHISPRPASTHWSWSSRSWPAPCSSASAKRSSAW